MPRMSRADEERRKLTGVAFQDKDADKDAWWRMVGDFASLCVAAEYNAHDQQLAWRALMLRGEHLGILSHEQAQVWLKTGLHDDLH